MNERLAALLGSDNKEIYEVRTHAPGPQGLIPLTEDMLRQRPSGDLFGLSQNAGMGWEPGLTAGPDYLILSTHGGLRAPDGSPIALGYHTGHWEVNLLVAAAAKELKAAKAVPFAAFCTDPCDGRTQGTVGMFDSLPYRNDAAVVLRRLIRSLPTRRGVLGVATCDKGLPAMMMALAGSRDLPSVLVPGGVTLMPTEGEDAGKVQTIGVRFTHGKISLQEAAEMGCRACASPGGGCQFLGTAATSQVVAEALGMALPHSALSPSGQPIWEEMAVRSARALLELNRRGLRSRDIVTDASIRNAMVVHAAFGGSTNVIMHLTAVAHAAGLRRPTVADWTAVNSKVPRIVDSLPNGPRNHPTVQVFLAGAVPEVMLHLRRLELLDTSVLTVTGETLDEVLNWWKTSQRRTYLRERLQTLDGINPDEVIASPEAARRAGWTSTVCFPTGNLAPEGSVIKSTSIDPTVVDADGVYRKTGPARVFTSEADGIAAIKRGDIVAGDILVLMGRGPMGSGMEETYQLTSALKHLDGGKHIALITDGRFSGVSTGACIGHVSPEALAGGPLGKVREGDRLEIVIDRKRHVGSVNLVGTDAAAPLAAEEAVRVLEAREIYPGLAPDPALPDDTRLWAALQSIGGGSWGGCVYDTDAILRVLRAGEAALRADEAANETAQTTILSSNKCQENH
jgi:xylonate dehydratase